MVALVAVPRTHDEIDWVLASLENTSRSYQAYLKAWPEGHYRHQASDTVDAMLWTKATAIGTPRALQSYLDAEPEGRFADQARSQQRALLADDGPFATARDKGSAQDLSLFLKEFPGHRREAEAWSLIEQIQFRDALAAGTIEVLATFVKTRPDSQFVAGAVTSIWELLQREFPADRFTASETAESLSTRLPEAIKSRTPLLVAFAPKEVRGRKHWAWTTKLREVSGVPVSIDTRNIRIQKRNGEIWVNEGSGKLLQPIHVVAFGSNSDYYWCEGNFADSYATLNFSIVRSTTMLLPPLE
jgi:hypothetical protein